MVADFEAIYKEHFLNVYRYVLSLCHNESLAEEITQEAFYKALNGIDRFDRRCQLYVWLCQIAKIHISHTLKSNSEIPRKQLQICRWMLRRK